MILQRRSFLTGFAASLIAAPALVRASSLMELRGTKLVAPVSPLVDANEEMLLLLRQRLNECYEATRQMMAQRLYGGSYSTLLDGTGSVQLRVQPASYPVYEFKQIDVELTLT